MPRRTRADYIGFRISPEDGALPQAAVDVARLSLSDFIRDVAPDSATGTLQHADQEAWITAHPRASSARLTAPAPRSSGGSPPARPPMPSPPPAPAARAPPPNRRRHAPEGRSPDSPV